MIDVQENFPLRFLALHLLVNILDLYCLVPSKDLNVADHSLQLGFPLHGTLPRVRCGGTHAVHDGLERVF
jgi:hypothetical protein